MNRPPPAAGPPLALLLFALLFSNGCSDDVQPQGADLDAAPADQAADVSGPDSGGSSAWSEVKTSGGVLRGVIQGGARAFLGIPYAAPPTGNQRFAAPAPHTGWTGTRQAAAFGPGCPQLPSTMGKVLPMGTPGAFTASEDCLTLNVWTPWPAPGKAAPVFVWIHGGGFTAGGSSVAHIAPAGLTLALRQGLVVVSLNYRLGPLGFLAHPALGKASGNFGLLDQRAALKWVQQNIAAFSGDPHNVTLAGESAGAFSVCAHITSTGSKGLFHRAVMESGACPQKFPQNSTVQPRAEAEALGKKLATKLGCTSANAATAAACLRAKPYKEVLSALPLSADLSGVDGGVSWGPNLDGTFLVKQPLDSVRAQTFNKVPVLLGTNQDEGTVLVAAAGLSSITTAAYTALLDKMFGMGAMFIKGRYAASKYKTPAHALADLMSDLVFICSARRSARALAAAGIKTYLYSFTTSPDFAKSNPFLGAYHGAEIPFVFGAPPPGLSFSGAEAGLSVRMMAYWSRFALAGDPNGGGAPAWSAFAKASDVHLVLGNKVAAASGLKQSACDFWDTLTP